MSWSPVLAQANEDLMGRSAVLVTAMNIEHPADLDNLLWVPATQVSDELQSPMSGRAYWVRIDQVKDMTGYLRIPGQAKVDLWTPGKTGKPVLTNGFYTPMHRLPVRGDPYIIPLESLGNPGSVLLRVVPFAQQPYPLRVDHFSAEEYETSKQRKFSARIGYHMYLGAGVIALLFLMGFALFQFIENRRRAYMYYGLYVFCMALYFGRILEYYYETPVFWGYFYEGYGLAEIVALMLSYIMYVQFARSFLNLDTKIPGLRFLFKLWIGLCLIMSVGGLILSFLQLHSASFWMTHSAIKILMLLVVVYFLWRIHRGRIPLAQYIVWGTGFLLAGSLFALAVTFVFTQGRGQMLGEPLFYMLTGTLLEAFCFAMGLGRQARQNELDKIEAQGLLIVQLEKERVMEREVQESRIQMLRAQMNPHFIFNALNSIQHFILSNQKEKSVRYLTQFARLIRRILHNSSEREISLNEELETLRAYIEIEQVRFHPAFTFNLQVDERLDLDHLRVPHMLIQPVIENAILHGLAPLKEDGILKLSVEDVGEERIRVVVEDNGIGRDAAAHRGKSRKSDHASMGIQSIRDRLRIQLPEIDEPLQIEDLFNHEGKATGTRVTILIPVVGSTDL